MLGLSRHLSAARYKPTSPSIASRDELRGSGDGLQQNGASNKKFSVTPYTNSVMKQRMVTLQQRVCMSVLMIIVNDASCRSWRILLSLLVCSHWGPLHRCLMIAPDNISPCWLVSVGCCHRFVVQPVFQHFGGRPGRRFHDMSGKQPRDGSTWQHRVWWTGTVHGILCTIEYAHSISRRDGANGFSLLLFRVF